MGEQRCRWRTANQPATAEVIDSAGSRGSSAAPQAPLLSRKTRPERHRKSDRRRDHRKTASRSRSDSKHSKSRETNRSRVTAASSPERPANPRVNPIFVWVRQEDNRIVDVKCEDYDKRNRILLTKTAQGWRAIPRTETLVPSLKEAVNTRDQQPHHHHHHHHHHRMRKSRKSKVRRKSTGVQVSSDIEQEEETEEQDPEEPEQPERNADDIETDDKPPPWMTADNVNIESLLPSHTIKVKRSTSPKQDSDVNSAESDCAQAPSIKCSADKICDVSPLDNLLAVAELEFNQQIQSGEWNKTSQSDIVVDANEDTIVAFDSDVAGEDADHKEFMENLEQLNNILNSEEHKLQQAQPDFERKSEDCDYTEDEDNNLAMDDILSRLEQSLRSPDSAENKQEVNREVEIKNVDYTSDNENNFKEVPELENFFDETDPKVEDETKPEIQEKPETTNIVESSTIDDEEPTDLSVKPTLKPAIDNNCDVFEGPTDLSFPKRMTTPRPCSQNSEAIQSPQPSGIPAVPQSPDIVSTTATSTNKSKSIFLESLLTNSSKKIALNSEVTITRQKEPLDLGKCRKSASPTVTCSEEINNTHTELDPPPSKKLKTVDVTLKNLLDADIQKPMDEAKNPVTETPRLLELLKNDSEPDPLTQLKQLISDPNVSIPDPMLVPKDKFSLILTRPGAEIPKLLKERPELRLPEALAYPHIMQDPNMLVLNIQHLESILSNKSAQEHIENSKSSVEKVLEKSKRQERSSQESPNNVLKRNPSKYSCSSSESQGKNFNELAGDIDAATQAALSQMVWLPYLNHLEAMSLSNNSDIMKMLSNSFPFYQNQISPDFSHMFGQNRFPQAPLGFPMQPPVSYGNPLEMNMWQEAMMQASMLRNKSSFENFNNKHSYKDCIDKSSPKKVSTSSNHRIHSSSKQQNYPSNFYTNNHSSSYQNPYMNYQSNSSKQSLHIPHQYNSAAHQRNFMSQQRQQGPSCVQQKPVHQQKLDGNQNFTNIYPHLSEQERHQYMQGFQFQQSETTSHRKETQKPKLSCKPFANLPQQKSEQQKEKSHPSCNDGNRQQTTSTTTTQPIDLSGSTTSTSKLKVKQHLIDPTNAPKLLKHHDDVPEVGSTTASIEEMQDAHKHLWHPLFGNQKGYTSPWNWTTVTATGE